MCSNSGILLMPPVDDSSNTESSTRRNLDHLEEQQWINAMSPTAKKSLISPGYIESANANKEEQKSALQVYEYVPYKILDRRAVTVISLKVIAELRFVLSNN
jgi:hypothetical protein